MTEPVVALLGRKDEPTDAIEQYCVHLGTALRRHDFAMQLVRVPWKESGWQAALRDLEQRAKEWRGQWVLLQYTALSWSARGFPMQVLRILRLLRRAGARVGVVYHDVEAYPGRRVVDHLRRCVQVYTFRRALRYSEQAVLTVPAEKLSWISAESKKGVFIPVGANFSQTPPMGGNENNREDKTPTVAVFGVTGGLAGQREVLRISAAVRSAAEKVGAIRLLVFGRNAESAEVLLREKLDTFRVTIHVEGVLPEDQIQRLISTADVLLFVRGPISSRRGSAIAGIACGLPVIAYAGDETAAPITDAGVVLVTAENKAAWGEALVRVLTDGEYRDKLVQRSLAAQRDYFSWEVIAAQYASLLKGSVA